MYLNYDINMSYKLILSQRVIKIIKRKALSLKIEITGYRTGISKIIMVQSKLYKINNKL